MIYYKNSEEIELIRESSLLVSKTLAEVAKHIRPGITSKQLDQIAEEFIRDHGAVPSFKGYSGFPASLCTSYNEEVVHGIPNDRELKDGDILSVDCGVTLNGFVGDSAYTFAIGEVSPKVLDLMSVTKASLYKGIENAYVGRRMGDISHAIQKYVEDHNYSVVRELVGHGVGKNLHEDPQVPNFGRKGNGIKLKKGLVIAIEPMVNMGKRTVGQSADGWTVYAADKKPSAHYEHTVAIGLESADILSTFDYIEESLKNNVETASIITEK